MNLSVEASRRRLKGLAFDLAAAGSAPGELGQDLERPFDRSDAPLPDVQEGRIGQFTLGKSRSADRVAGGRIPALGGPMSALRESAIGHFARDLYAVA